MGTWQAIDIQNPKKNLTSKINNFFKKLDAVDIQKKILDRMHQKWQAVDIQNATLAGGVIVGASADMMLQVLVTIITLRNVLLSCLFFVPCHILNCSPTERSLLAVWQAQWPPWVTRWVGGSALGIGEAWISWEIRYQICRYQSPGHQVDKKQ